MFSHRCLIFNSLSQHILKRLFLFVHLSVSLSPFQLPHLLVSPINCTPNLHISPFMFSCYIFYANCLFSFQENPRSDLEKWAMVCWAIWNVRNQFLFKQYQTHPSRILNAATTLLIDQQQPTLWQSDQLTSTEWSLLKRHVHPRNIFFTFEWVMEVKLILCCLFYITFIPIIVWFSFNTILSFNSTKNKKKWD